MKIISFDTSTTNTGMAVFEDDKLVKAESLITPKSITKWSDRLNWMGKAILERVLFEKPEEIVCEAMVVKNTETTKMLAEAVGMARSAAAMVNAKFYEMRPSEWRKACLDEEEPSPEKLAGIRFMRDDWKAWSVDRVCRRYLKTENDNVSDAVLIGIAHLRKKSSLN